MTERSLLSDLGEVRRTDAVIEALAARRPPGPGEPDLAVGLLRALVEDVDDPPSADRDGEPGGDPSGPGPRRRHGPRTIVTLGVSGLVLASTGVAAAGGGFVEERPAAPPVSAPALAGDTDREAGDTAVGTHERPAPPRGAAPSRPSDGRGRAVAKQPDNPGRAELERLRRHLERLLAGRPDRRDPGRYGPSGRTIRRDTPDDLRRLRLEDLRKRTEQHLNRYRYP